MGDTDIVLQGGLWSETIHTACQYAELPFVNDVIISSWHSDIEKLGHIDHHPNIKYVFQNLPEVPGSSNMNFQILSSRIGIALSTAPYVVKMRSDQHIFDDSMNTMHRFFRKFHRQILPGSHGSIFVLGMVDRFPYHPQDHVFWGARNDILQLFSCPLVDSVARQSPDFGGLQLRDPIHLGAHYCAQFDAEVNLHLDDPTIYLTDAGPKRDAALEVWDRLRDRVFRAFPRIEMYWEKYDSPYWYDQYEPQGEYYHDATWE
jgi:hypothetical protein